MYVIKFEKKSGQLETVGGYEIVDFHVNSSYVAVTTMNSEEKKIKFSSTKCLIIYTSNNLELLSKGGCR